MIQSSIPPSPKSHSIAARQREIYPSAAWVFRMPMRLVVFGFGSGLLRPASGTWGTLAAWLLWIAAKPFIVSYWIVGLFLALAFAYGCWACLQICRQLNTHDHIGIVFDEMVAFWLVLWLVPAGWWHEFMAFLLFRLFDITKPLPIKWLETHIEGGIGVMIDDIFAALYTVVVMLVITKLVIF